MTKYNVFLVFFPAEHLVSNNSKIIVNCLLENVVHFSFKQRSAAD